MYADIARRCRLSGPTLHRIGLRLWAEYDRRAGEPAQQEIDDREPYLSGAALPGMPAILFKDFAALDRQ